MEAAGTVPERRPSRTDIYGYLYRTTGFCSRQRISEDLGLSLPTVYQALSELMELGLIRTSGEQKASRGRRPQGLEIVPDARFAIGVSLTEDRLRLSAVDLRLSELAHARIPLDSSLPFSELGPLLARELEAFLESAGLERERLLGVGIALPAVLDAEARRVVLAPTLSFRNLSLDDLTSPIPYPTQVANDSSSGGLAECFVRQTRRNMAYLSLENGVGGAILAGGTPYLGDNRRSGEFGHMCVEPGGRRCRCGRLGCLEAFCSTRRIEEETGLSLDVFFEKVRLHSPEHELLWYDMLRHLAVGISNIRMALDCDVVLGGVLSQYLPPFLPRLREYVAALDPFEGSADYLQLSTLRRHTVSLGAAVPFLQQFLDTV